MRLRTLLIALLSPAVVLLFAAIPPESPSGGCADRIAQALTSPAAPVHDSFACFAPSEQLQAAMGGYVGDAGLQQLAKEHGYTYAHYVGRTGLGFQMYEFSGPDRAPSLVLLLVNSDGKVMRIDQDQP